MKCFCSTSLGLAIATGLLLSSCGKDLQTTEPATEIVVPIQIQAGVGSTFTYELKRYDNTGALIDQDGGEIVLTNKNASFAGRSGVHQFTVNGLPVWQYQVDAQDNMWEYHPAISGGSIHYAARWQRLPTSGPGKYESVIFDSAMSTPNSHLKQ